MGGSKLHVSLLELNFPTSWHTCCENCKKAYDWLQEALVHGSKLHAALLEVNASWHTCCQDCKKAYDLLQEALQHAANLQAALLELNFPTSEQHCCEEAGEVKCLNFILFTIRSSHLIYMKNIVGPEKGQVFLVLFQSSS